MLYKWTTICRINNANVKRVVSSLETNLISRKDNYGIRLYYAISVLDIYGDITSGRQIHYSVSLVQVSMLPAGETDFMHKTAFLFFFLSMLVSNFSLNISVRCDKKNNRLVDFNLMHLILIDKMLHLEPFFYFICSKEIPKYLRFLEIKRAFPFSSVECWHNGKEITIHPCPHRLLSNIPAWFIFQLGVL